MCSQPTGLWTCTAPTARNWHSWAARASPQCLRLQSFIRARTGSLEEHQVVNCVFGCDTRLISGVVGQTDKRGRGCLDVLDDELTGPVHQSSGMSLLLFCGSHPTDNAAIESYHSTMVDDSTRVRASKHQPDGRMICRRDILVDGDASLLSTPIFLASQATSTYQHLIHGNLVQPRG